MEQISCICKFDKITVFIRSFPSFPPPGSKECVFCILIPGETNLSYWILDFLHKYVSCFNSCFKVLTIPFDQLVVTKHATLWSWALFVNENLGFLFLVCNNITIFGSIALFWECLQRVLRARWFVQKAIFKSYSLNWKTYYVAVTRKILLSHFKNLQKHKFSEMAASIEEVFA